MTTEDICYKCGKNDAEEGCMLIIKGHGRHVTYSLCYNCVAVVEGELTRKNWAERMK
jgi:hypothetical protein